MDSPTCLGLGYYVSDYITVKNIDLKLLKLVPY